VPLFSLLAWVPLRSHTLPPAAPWRLQGGGLLTQLVEQSTALCRDNQRMLRTSRSLIAVNRRRLNPYWGVSGSSDDDVHGALLKSVQERLECRALPSAPDKVWAGNGTGQTCIICTKTIYSDEIENEAVVSGDGVAITLWAHLGCLDVWRRATRAHKSECPSSEAGSSNDHPA